MASTKDFNPKAPLVVRKARGMKLNGRQYNQGDPIEDDTLSMRKRQQLYSQNYLCYAYELEGKTLYVPKATDSETAAAKAAEDQAKDDAAQVEAEARADADKRAIEQAQADADKAKALSEEEDEQVASDSKENKDDKKDESEAALKPRRKKVSKKAANPAE